MIQRMQAGKATQLDLTNEPNKTLANVPQAQSPDKLDANTGDSLAEQPIQVEEVVSISIFGKGWQLLQAHWKETLIVYLVLFGTYVFQKIVYSFLVFSVSLLSSLIFILVNWLLSIGLTIFFIRMVRGEEFEWVELISHVERLWNWLVTSLVFGLLLVLGYILFIIPGIYFNVKYLFAVTIAVDKNASWSQAFKMSSKMTQGIKLKLLWLGILAVFINLAGVLTIVGWVITWPLTRFAYTYLYDQLLVRTEID